MMDIAALSSAMSQTNLKSSVGVAMLDKTMELNSELGANLVKMIDHSMELSVNPNVGSNIDVSV
ncbi:MAG: YjfB family protein [Lachnospiraceae bacterium]